MDDKVREFLKANKPEPASEAEKASLMRISMKALIVFLIFLVVCVGIWISDGGETGMLSFFGVFLLMMAVIILLLEAKDKIKIKSYKKIYSTYVYVEKCFFANKAYHITVQYYDADYGMFHTAKMHIDRMDCKDYASANGAVIRLLVGEKNSKISYIAMKSLA